MNTLILSLLSPDTWNSQTNNYSRVLSAQITVYFIYLWSTLALACSYLLPVLNCVCYVWLYYNWLFVFDCICAVLRGSLETALCLKKPDPKTDWHNFVKIRLL